MFLQASVIDDSWETALCMCQDMHRQMQHLEITVNLPKSHKCQQVVWTTLISIFKNILNNLTDRCIRYLVWECILRYCLQGVQWNTQSWWLGAKTMIRTYNSLIYTHIQAKHKLIHSGLQHDNILLMNTVATDNREDAESHWCGKWLCTWSVREWEEKHCVK